MAACSPQRFLANNRNAVRLAALTPSSVLPIADAVLSIPTARNGSAQVALTGAYSGAEPATYDVEIVDDTLSTPLISKPVLTGEGSGSLSGIASNGPAQDWTVELAESGIPLLAAAVDFEGVTVKARTPGDAGNDVFITVDQSGLTFTAQSFSLLHDLEAGAGGKDNALRGAEYDYNTKILGADNQIPADAHRISFGADRSAIYLQYKQYLDGEWLYHFVPALKRAVPKGTVINFVTGGRTVKIQTGSPVENTYTGIVTLYDLLSAIKTDLGSPQPPLADVDGVVANDRSPTGQASQELQTRTDAHVEPSSGTGSAAAAQGFEDTSCTAGAGTQLVTATCTAVSVKDHPLAHVGKTRWALKSSTLGDLGTIVEGELYEGDEFNVRVPTQVPPEFGTPKGRFSVTSIDYVARDDPDEDPTITAALCPRKLTLGAAAVDQTIQLKWTKRPTGDCLCDGMAVPDLDMNCLGLAGLTGDEAMGYQSDTVTRLKALRQWFRDLTRTNSYVDSGNGSAVQDPFLTEPAAASGSPNSMSLKDVVDLFETTLAKLDPLEAGSPSPRSDGCLAWDDAVSELQADIAKFDTGNTDTTNSIPTDRYVAAMAFVLTSAGLSPLGEFDASPVVSGDGCWRDFGGDYWTVVGSNGAYAPLFNNHPYVSSARASEKGAYYSTHEFGLVVMCKCPENLKYGDTINLAIGDAGWPAMYQLEDELVLPIIAAAPLYLAGGQDASLVEKWLPTGSVSGPLPSYNFDPNAPVPYSDGSPPLLTFLLEPGGIPFAKGDLFRFSAEGGHYRTRKDGGAWSAPAAIPSGPVAFDSGLSIEFTTGAAPSFVAADMFSFTALQPWAASNIQTPNADPWKWSGSGGSMVADAGEVVSVDGAAFAYHTLPEGATITIEGGTSPGVYTWSETATWNPDTIGVVFAATHAAQYLRLTVANATGGQIGWWWCGQMLSQSLSADTVPRLVWKVNRGDGGLNPSARFIGKGIGGEIAWTESALNEADMAGLVAMMNWVKENDDEPFVYLSQLERPDESHLVKLLVDEVDVRDAGRGQRKASVERRYELTLPLQAVLQ